MGNLINVPGDPPGAQLINGFNPALDGRQGNRLLALPALNAHKLNQIPAGWQEVEGYRERWRSDGTQEMTRVFQGPWNGRGAFRDYMLGWSALFDLGALNPAVALGGQRFFITREIPFADPEYPWLYCVDCRVLKGQGAMRPNPDMSTGHPQPQPQPGIQPPPLVLPGPVAPTGKVGYYDTSPDLADPTDPQKAAGLSALVECLFSSLDYRVLTDGELAAMPNNQGELERFVVREPKFTVQSQPLPLGQLFFARDGGPHQGQQIPDNAAYKLLFRGELTYTWHQAPGVNWDALQACIGAVNSAAFDGAANGAWPPYPPETLLCTAPPSLKIYRTVQGQRQWRHSYSFIWRPEGWNTLIDGDGLFHRVAYANGTPMFPLADFNTLFRLTKQQPTDM